MSEQIKELERQLDELLKHDPVKLARWHQIRDGMADLRENMAVSFLKGLMKGYGESAKK